MCPSGAALTYDVPPVLSTTPTEVLDQDTYLHWTVDGDSDASVSCSVDGTSAFSGRIGSGAASLAITDGVLTDGESGTARISAANSARLPTNLTSPAADCVVTVVRNSGRPQVKPGSIWASFTCASLEHAPSDACAAKGTFVLENCAQ